MRRLLIVLGVLGTLTSMLPARAGSATGRVAIAAVHPTFARTAWSMSHASNGMTGYVFRLDADADDKPYTLTVTRGATGLENPDIYFYEDRGGAPGASCTESQRTERFSSETGIVCPGPQRAAWAIVVLVSGADARFSFTY